MLYGFTLSAAFRGACFPLSALYRHFIGFTACHILTRLNACHLSTLRTSATACGILLRWNESQHTPPKRERNHRATTQAGTSAHRQPNKPNTNTDGDRRARCKIKILYSGQKCCYNLFIIIYLLSIILTILFLYSAKFYYIYIIRLYYVYYSFYSAFI